MRPGVAPHPPAARAPPSPRLREAKGYSAAPSPRLRGFVRE